jgi:hypothetical protein
MSKNIFYGFYLQGFNAIHHEVLNVLGKRMTSWERYCFRNFFTLPEGFAWPEDVCNFFLLKVTCLIHAFLTSVAF